MVISTLLLSAAVVTLVGWTLMRQITGGLVDSRTETSIAEATRGNQEAEERLRAASSLEAEPATQLNQLTSTLVTRGLAQGYEVVVSGPLQSGRTGAARAGGVSSTTGVQASSIPTTLSEAVEDPDHTGTSWTYTTIEYRPETGRSSIAGVVTGSTLIVPANGSTYAVYNLFPLTEEQRTLSLVRQALLTSGALLLALVAGITWLVTRQVVTPVRLARRTAERLASGRLEERMQVKGADDLARLGGSFNQMAASLQKQIRKLEDMSASQRRFVSDVSHELRTPLTTVRMAGDVLHDARAQFDPATARSAELLQHELDRFEGLLVDLLEISRFDAGAANLELEDVNLADVARRVVAENQTLAESRGTHLVVRVIDDPAIAEVDVRRVERILRNLVTNAIDYAGSDDVVVSVASNRTAAAVTVRDYGIGLKPGDETRVFSRFWRADPARTRTSGGTGLGLSIALEDARLHGGWLQAWGSPGQGSQFRLTVPRRAGDPVIGSPIPLDPRYGSASSGSNGSSGGDVDGDGDDSADGRDAENYSAKARR